MISAGTINTGSWGSSPSIDVCRLNDTQAVQAYHSSGSGGLNVRILDLSSGNMVAGTKLAPAGGGNWGRNPRVCRLDDTHFVVTYYWGATPGLAAIAFSVSGTTISEGTIVPAIATIDSGEYDLSSPDSTHFVIAYTDGADSDYGKMIPCTVSGTTITTYAGSIVTYYSGSSNFQNLQFADSSRWFLSYYTSGGKIRVATGTLSGTTISIDYSADVWSGAVSTMPEGKSMAVLSATKVVISVETTNLYAFTVSYSGTYTVGGLNLIYSGSPYGSSVMAIDGTYIGFAYGVSGATSSKFRMAKVSGTTITPAVEQTWASTTTTTSDETCSCCALTSSLIVFAHSGTYSYYAGFDSNPISASLSTQACSSVTNITLTGNGTISNVGYASCTTRGFCYKVYDGSDPDTGDSTASDAGTFSTGAYTKGVTSLTANTYYSVRAYVINSEGTYYGTTVNQYMNGITDPANAYSDDANYATCHASNGNLKVKLSKDTGATWSSELTEGFGNSETTETYGDGTTELWGLGWTTDDLNSATAFKLRVTVDNDVQSTWSFAGWGFAMPAGKTLTGIKVDVKGYAVAGVFYINHITVSAYYGTSTIPVVAGSMAFASNGRKDGEGAGAGTGLAVYYDGSNWIRPSDDTTVAA